MSSDESEGPDPNGYRGPCLNRFENHEGVIYSCSLRAGHRGPHQSLRMVVVETWPKKRVRKKAPPKRSTAK